MSGGGHYLGSGCLNCEVNWEGGGTLTLGGQPPGMTGRRGEAETGREGLRRPGHHADTVNVSGRELPPPRRTPEVFVVALETSQGKISAACFQAQMCNAGMVANGLFLNEFSKSKYSPFDKDPRTKKKNYLG